VSEADLERRMAAVEARVSAIDQHGTRGMEGVRVQLGGIERDLGKLETQLGLLSQAVNKIPPPRSQWPLLLPMYGVVVAVLTLAIDLVVR
jgi:hypothetical protein